MDRRHDHSAPWQPQRIIPTRYVRGHRAAHGANLPGSLQHALSRWGASAFGCTEPTFLSEVVLISGYFGPFFFNFTGGRPFWNPFFDILTRGAHFLQNYGFGNNFLGYYYPGNFFGDRHGGHGG